MSKVFGRLLVAGGSGGSIVNISSIAGKVLSPNTAAYAASKAGLQALTACMVRRGRPVRRAGQRHLPRRHRHVADGRPRPRARCGTSSSRTRIPLGRAGTGDDIAHTVVYLCSDQGAWVTGQSWNVDGGTVVQH